MKLLLCLFVALVVTSCSNPAREIKSDTHKNDRLQVDRTFVFFQRSENDYKWDKGKTIATSKGDPILSLISKARPWPPNGRRPFADPGESSGRTPSPIAALEVSSRGLNTIYHFTKGGSLVYRSSNFDNAGKERLIISPDDQAALIALIHGLRDQGRAPLTK